MASIFSATHCTKIKERKLRVKGELMFLYRKKQRLNQILYQTHLASQRMEEHLVFNGTNNKRKTGQQNG